MAKLLGTPYERGKSDSIVSRTTDAAIAEGLVVSDAGDGKVKTFADGDTPFGVMGQREIAGSSVVVSGLRVYVQADDSCVPVVGKQVFVKDGGKVTSVSESNTGVKAEFAAAVVYDDGVVDNTADKSKAVKCVLINFVGGF